MELAHFRKGSVEVVAGARVREDEILGKVGNTGNTSELHLHVHARADRIRNQSRR